MGQKTHPLVVVIGETASGKSALALRLALAFDGEIICADSWTVRREVNVGTAKPSAADRAKVPHHLLDIVGPDEDFTAAVFKRLAVQAIDDITSRGKLPILVGGTGLYIDGVIYDYGFLPAGDRADREKLNKLNVEELVATIDKLDIDLGDVDRRNKRRLIRLVETNGAQPKRQGLRPNTFIIGLKVERGLLKQRIIARTDNMLAAGLEREVETLYQQYGWDCEALKGVGYAQWKGYFADTQTLAETRQKIIKATLDLAKRQRTWFRRPMYRSLSASAPPSLAKSAPSSFTVPNGMLQSPRTDLAQRSSAQKRTVRGTSDARNKSIQWQSTPVNWQSVVDAVTTFLETAVS